MKDTKDMKSSNELYSIFIITIFLILCLFLNACSLIPSKEEDSPPGTSPDPAAAKTYSPIVLEDHTSDLYGGTWIASCNEYLPLRQEPSGASKLVGRVLKGDTVQLIAYDSLFAKVNYEGKEGYVMAAYLVPANEESHNKELQIIKAVESYSYEQMTADLQSLADAYPAKLTIDSIGKSELGKDIPIAILGDTSASHHILVHGAIHGREHMTSTLIMSQMEYLLSHKNTKFLESSIKDALNDVCLHLIPMVNPDGVEISQKGQLPDDLISIYEQDLKQKKTGLSLMEYARRWKANANGVDLNRNFDAGWEAYAGAGGASSERYKGQSPSDQSETAALSDYTLRYPFDAAISYHSNGSIIYYEYGIKEPVNSLSKSLAEAVSHITQYPLVGSEGIEAGGFKDWAMDSLGIPSLTIEVGYRQSPLVLDEFSSIYERNKYVLPLTALWAKDRLK